MIVGERPDHVRADINELTVELGDLLGMLADAMMRSADCTVCKSRGYDSRLLHPSHRRAEVVGLHNDCGAPRSKPSVKGVGDLGGQTLLQLGSAGVAFQHAGQLGEADDPLVRYVTYVGLADERQ